MRKERNMSEKELILKKRKREYKFIFMGDQCMIAGRRNPNRSFEYISLVPESHAKNFMGYLVKEGFKPKKEKHENSST